MKKNNPKKFYHPQQNMKIDSHENKHVNSNYHRPSFQFLVRSSRYEEVCQYIPSLWNHPLPATLPLKRLTCHLTVNIQHDLSPNGIAHLSVPCPSHKKYLLNKRAMMALGRSPEYHWDQIISKSVHRFSRRSLLKFFSIYSPGGHFVQQSRTVWAIFVDSHLRNIPV